MAKLDLEALARAAEQAADLARKQILPRFRRVATETKQDGTPVTEADRAAERAIRAHLRAAFPEIAIQGEEYGEKRFRASIRRAAHLDPGELRDSVINDAMAFFGDMMRKDDITMVIGKVS